MASSVYEVSGRSKSGIRPTEAYCTSNVEQTSRRRRMTYIVKENKDGTVTISKEVYEELHSKAEVYTRIMEYIETLRERYLIRNSEVKM